MTDTQPALFTDPAAIPDELHSLISEHAARIRKYGTGFFGYECAKRAIQRKTETDEQYYAAVKLLAKEAKL